MSHTQTGYWVLGIGGWELKNNQDKFFPCPLRVRQSPQRGEPAHGAGLTMPNAHCPMPFSPSVGKLSLYKLTNQAGELH